MIRSPIAGRDLTETDQPDSGSALAVPLAGRCSLGRSACDHYCLQPLVEQHQLMGLRTLCTNGDYCLPNDEGTYGRLRRSTVVGQDRPVNSYGYIYYPCNEAFEAHNISCEMDFLLDAGNQFRQLHFRYH
jgi:hypothetical protein